MSDKNVKLDGQLDFAGIRTYSVKERRNLVTIGNETGNSGQIRTVAS